MMAQLPLVSLPASFTHIRSPKLFSGAAARVSPINPPPFRRWPRPLKGPEFRARPRTRYFPCQNLLLTEATLETATPAFDQWPASSDFPLGPAALRLRHRVRALEELAKHYEHRERNYSMALEMTRSALAISETPDIRRREARLKSRIDRPRTSRLAL